MCGVGQPDGVDASGRPHRARAVLLGTVTLGGFGLSLGQVYPYLEPELMRASRSELVMDYSGELTALAMLVYYLVASLIGRPASNPQGTRYAITPLVVAMLALGGGCLTSYFRGWRSEGAAYARSAETPARITRIERSDYPSHEIYLVTCQFDGPGNRIQSAIIRVDLYRHDGDEHPLWIPTEFREQLRSGHAASVAIRYDPRWPQRAWLKWDSPPSPVRKLVTIRIAICLLHISVLFALIGKLRERGERSTLYPYRSALPFVLTTAFLILFAVADIGLKALAWPGS